MSILYDRISQMEPLLPSNLPERLQELAIEVIRQSAKLGAMLHPITCEVMLELFREMNCYYSNLIEGHKTSPLDIQRALKQDFSKDPANRALQQESVAHIQVQKLIENKLKMEPNVAICSLDFLCWIHKEFYDRLPEEFTIVRGANGLEDKIIAGSLRTREVKVGDHIPPSSIALKNFLDRFSEIYKPQELNPLMQVVAAAASHHRLAWIHPFLDGNGRVIRLFSDAYFVKAKIDGHGLWTLSRGLARHRSRYMNALATADMVRQGDLDGRGNLSQKGLIFFCEFFLETALDQINFVSDLLDIVKLQKRMERYINKLVDENSINPQAIYLLRAAFLQGELTRREISHICGLKERAARMVLKQCLDKGLLVSKTPKGPVRLGLPIEAVEYYFANLLVESS